MKTLPVLLSSALWALPAPACDRVGAASVQLAFAEAGTSWSEQGGRVTVEWGRAWDGAAPASRLALLRTFADGDACLSGITRKIAFYRHRRLVGLASPAGIELLPPPGASAAAAAPAHACP